MAALIRNRQLVANPLSRSERVLKVDPHQEVEEVAKRLQDIDRVEINFPKFGDGRGFSIARLLRSRYGYRGELRAVGHIVRDHLQPLEAVGFDSFLLKDGEDAEAALAAFTAFQLFTPWDSRR